MTASDRRMELTGELALDLLNAAPDTTVIVDSRGVVQFVNSRIEEVFGYVPTEVIGRSLEILLPERFRGVHSGHRMRFFGQPRPRPMGTGLDLYGLHKDGREFPVEISLSPVLTRSGLLVSAGIRDITDRKAIEQALTEARNEADRANRAKSAFLAAASHDLRQPVQTLTLLNTALGRIAPAGSRQAEIAAVQAEALGGMAELLNSLLDISKLEAGAVKPDIDDCSVRTVFERLRAQFAAPAEAKGLQLIVDDCNETVRTDPALLAQLIQNLIANAIRYTHQGLVELRCVHHTNTVRIEVVDTGIGIPATNLSLIFEEFYQCPRQPGERREGLGLGLSIVRRVADLLELQVEVESTPGQGSRFIINVPRGVNGYRCPVTAPPAPRRTREDPPVILVVDDNEAVAGATALLLDVEGYRPVLARDFGQAQERLARLAAPPDLIICDFHLGDGPSGFDTIRALRELTGLTIPALLVTGDTANAAAALASQIERCEFLSKPIQGDQLLGMLGRMFS